MLQSSVWRFMTPVRTLPRDLSAATTHMLTVHPADCNATTACVAVGGGANGSLLKFKQEQTLQPTLGVGCQNLQHVVTRFLQL